MIENQTGAILLSFEYAEDMCKILKNNLSVKLHTTIDSININKKKRK